MDCLYRWVLKGFESTWFVHRWTSPAAPPTFCRRSLLLWWSRCLTPLCFEAGTTARGHCPQGRPRTVKQRAEEDQCGQLMNERHEYFPSICRSISYNDLTKLNFFFGLLTKNFVLEKARLQLLPMLPQSSVTVSTSRDNYRHSLQAHS